MGDGGDRGHREAVVEAGELPAQWNDAQWLRRLIGAIPVFMIRMDRSARCLYFNQIVRGLEIEEVLGHSAYEFLAPEDHDKLRAALERIAQTGEPQRYVAKGIGPDGTQVHYETLIAGVGDDSGDAAMMAYDVTEHVERAEALQESKEQLRMAIDATGLGLWSWDRRTGEVSWNDRLHEITGRDEPVPPDRWIEELVAPEDAERVAAEQGANVEHRLPHRIIRSDGTIRWVLRIGQDVTAGGDLVRGGVLDSTRQCELEERLRAAQRREAVGTLTAGVAHNFNNVLAVIQPSIEIALRSAEGRARTALTDALQAAERAADLVSQLMTYAGQRTKAYKVLAGVPELVEHAVRMCRQTFERQVRLNVSVTGDPRLVRGDLSDLEQLVLNLLINARDAVEPAGDPEISVSIAEVDARDPSREDSRSGRFVRIQVTDNGGGMDNETLERVFEPFFTQKEPGLGTGLGLATSYAIAKEHGGWISFESREGRGTCASVFLPVAEGRVETAPSRPSPRPIGPARILVVEDETAVRNIVSEVLEEMGHTVLKAEDASRAAALLESGEAPDIVLLDRSMPGWPARRAVDEIRRRASSAKILYFTGQNVPPTEQELVDGVVYKPVSIQDLEEAIDGCLGGR